MDRVWELSERLRRDGVDCRVDQQGEPEEGWPRWSRNQTQESEFVLVVCTEVYLRRYQGKVAQGTGRGSNWEGFVITQELYEADGKNKKFIPILFSSSDKQFIPTELRGFTYYEPLTDSGYYQLFRRITNQPELTASPVNPELRKMAKRTTPAFPPVKRTSPSPNPEPADEFIPQPRILDAAIPSHVLLGMTTELLVLIHLPSSKGLQGILQSDEDAEAKPEDVRSKPFDVIFRCDSDGRPMPLKTTVTTVTSPDFSPATPSPARSTRRRSSATRRSGGDFRAT